MEIVEPIEEESLTEVSPLPSPAELRRRLALPEAGMRFVRAARQALADVIHGRDPRLVVVVGPCSIHDPEAALDYAERLREVANATSDRLLIVMRTYVEKPRTTVGWKGLINDPWLDGSCDLAAGLELARRTLLAINALGVPCGSELLDPATPRYLGDLFSWAAIGARTSQSQPHREMASGLPMPVGFKNGTDGSLECAVNAMKSAGHPHTFVAVGESGGATVVRTRGNPNCHVILRGGALRPNFGLEDVARAARLLAAEGIARPILIDCSHGNSGKDHTKQAGVLREVLAQLRGGERRIGGILLESNLHAGKQAWPSARSLDYGVSITDACIGWEETEALLYEIAAFAPFGNTGQI
jgi:3-deoxy-7-phosphoheptulonate synthase